MTSSGNTHTIIRLTASGLGLVPVATALSLMCSQMQRDGRPFELVFRQPEYGYDDSLDEVVGQLRVLQPLVHVRVESRARAV